MAIYTTVDGRRIRSTTNPDGTKTKEVLYDPNAGKTVTDSNSAPTNIDQTQSNLQQTIAQPIESPVQATNLQPTNVTGLPEPTAPAIQEAAITGLAGEVEKARNTIDTRLNNDKAVVDAEIATLEKERDEILKKGEQLTQPFREKLENKERERLYINKNFEENQKLIDELDTLLTEGNELIKISKGRAVANTVLQKSVNKTIADVQARAGVIQAVISARSGQIAEAQRLIDRTVSAITADRQDQISYYDTLLQLNNQNLINLDNESKAIAEEQKALAYSDLEQAQKTANYVKSLMINPDTAQFMANAGIKLTDDIDTITGKMEKEATRIDNINEAQASVEIAIQSGFASDTELATLNQVKDNPIAVKELADRIIARAGADAVRMKQEAHNSSMASARWGRRAQMLALAAEGDPDAIEALGFDPRVAAANSQEAMQAHAIESMENQSMLDAVSRMKSNDSGIKSSTGVAKSAFLQGLFAGPIAGEGSEKRGALSRLFSLTPVVGNISNSVYAMNQKNNLLSDATFLVNNATFKKIINLKQQGVTPGQLTEAERRAFGAADVLGSLLDVEADGSVTGIRGTEANFRRAMQEFEDAILLNQDFANTDFLTPEEKAALGL